MEKQTEENVDLVGHDSLLEALFPNEKDRPGLKWLADLRKSGKIPYLKMGGKMIRYRVADVRAAIDENFTVEVAP